MLKNKSSVIGGWLPPPTFTLGETLASRITPRYIDEMTRHERAAQLWSVLALAARMQHILSYELAGRLTGLPRQSVGDFLYPIQDYCLQNNLPPLTALVVSEQTGLPSEGFIAAQDVLPAQNRVFVFDWVARGAPSSEELERAYRNANHRDEPIA
ncbi:MAG: hypothetical protein L0Z50_06250 [Verrucomicrobiales bacterium]|nr:hypothetical protein [Verrucomicrobiales bacterium]